MSCTAKRSERRPDPALRVGLGIPGAADAARRCQIYYEIHADLALPAFVGRETHAPLRDENAPLRAVALLRLQTGQQASKCTAKWVPTCLCALSWEFFAALRR